MSVGLSARIVATVPCSALHTPEGPPTESFRRSTPKRSRGLFTEVHQSPMGQLGAGRPAVLELLELIAVLGIVEEVGEVVKELHAVALHVAGEAGRIVRARRCQSNMPAYR